MTRYFLVGIFLLFQNFTLFAQQSEPIISTFSSQHGLPRLKINRMATDSSGQLWMGSNIGLHRFDGNQFQTFNTLPKSMIGDIQVDHDGVVYIAILSHGLAVYNKATNDFNIVTNDDVFKNSLGKYVSILITKDNRVLLSLNGKGVYELEKKDGVIKPILLKKQIDLMLLHPKDANKIILVADSLLAFDLTTKQHSVILDEAAVEVVIDGDNQLWYTRFDYPGLIMYNFETGKNTPYMWKSTGRFTDYDLEYHNDKIYIAAERGLRIYNIKEDIWTDYYEDKGAVSELHVDLKGRLWFGQDNALHVISPQNQLFRYFEDSKGKSYTAIAQIGKDEFLLAPFFDKHLEKLDVSKGTIERIELPSKYRNLEYPLDIEVVNDLVYIAYNTGVLTYDPSLNQFKQLTFERYRRLIEDNVKKALFKSTDGLLWMSAFTEGILLRVDPRNLRIDSMIYPDIVGEYLQEISVLEDGSLIQPSETGLFMFRFGDQNPRHLPFIKDDEAINLVYIDDILIDGESIWILVGSRILIGTIGEDEVVLDREVDKSNVFDYNLGLSIMKCEDGDKIILTSSGINIYSEETDEFTPYGINEGLINADRRMRMEGFGDHLFFLSEGITYARKSELGVESYNPKVDIYSVEVDGKVVRDTSDLVFANTANDIKISFKSIDLTKPLDVKYRYRLSEENSWIYADYNDGEVYLLDLNPGSYKFEVSAKHLYSNWSKNQVLSFQIQQPIWKRWWFLLILLGVILGIVYLIYRRQIKRSREFADLRTRMAELENEALRAQMNPHFIFNSLNSIKSYIIEHEKEDAADYLTDFSDLIRLILANSREKYIAIEKELEALKLYMDIENIRLEGKFTYEINCEVSNAMIQPLTLQPFIENAIWHGFIHKKENGNLIITIKEFGENIKISIEDDGVGRERSREIEKRHDRKRSFGIIITKERLAQSNINNDIQIVDLIDEDGNGNGTRVDIIIPHIKPT